MSKWICEDEYIKLEKVNQQLLEALKAVEWVKDDSGVKYCPRCDHLRISGHDEKCPLQQALAAEGDTDE